jgi:predicted porin
MAGIAIGVSGASLVQFSVTVHGVVDAYGQYVDGSVGQGSTFFGRQAFVGLQTP